MEHIKKQLETILNKKGLGQIAQASRVCFIFSRDKKKILGERVNADALSFKNGKLKLWTSSSTEASEVRLLQGKIKKELNEKLGNNLVEKIEVVLTS